MMILRCREPRKMKSGQSQGKVVCTMTAKVLFRRSLAVLLSFVMVAAWMPAAEIGGKAQAAVAADNSVVKPIVENNQSPAVKKSLSGGNRGNSIGSNPALRTVDGDVDIDTAFPDEAFCSYVLANIDSDQDGMLSASEIQEVTYIDVSNQNIASLAGIEVFYNLEWLYCYYNSISELDVSGNTALTDLSCYGNGMTSLILGENSVLSCIHCENNNLTELNVQGLSALSVLDCDENQLTSLDVSKNSALEYLNCSSNQLTELTLGENSTLAYVNAQANKLSSLDISKATFLNNAVLDENAEIVQYYYYGADRFYDIWSYENNGILVVDSVTQVIATQPLGYCTVTFDSDGGSEVSSVSVLSGGRIVRPADPEKENYVFAGWYQDAAFVTPFEFGEYGTQVESNITLYACWYQPVNIADTFPDEVFCEFVRQYDTDEDGKLSYSEIQYVTYMDVSNMGISSLEGIETFCNLYEIHCSYNSISSLDLSSNKALTSLYCNYCGLESLTFGENTVLTSISCYGNNLTVLDVQGLSALYCLDCSDNELTELIVSENPLLYSLNCVANQITSLDVSENGALSYLNCSQNQLTELTLGENDALEYVYANVNKLSSLDVSGVPLIDEAVLNGEVEQIYWDPNDYFESWGYDGYSRLQVDSVTEVIASQTYERYTVTFDTDGGTDIPSVSVLPGRRIPRPVDPEKEGWAFAGWYQDTAFATPFEFGEYGTLIENDTTIYACWYKPVNVADTFPDEVFYTYIMNNIDSDQDGILSYSEIQNVMYLYLDEMGIQSLQGIDVFVNLTDLYCSNNSLSALDVSGNKNLINLSCYSNGMTSLVLGENSVLSCIHCENNNLTELNVQGLSALSVLYCEWNQLTSLDVSKNSAIEYLYCSSNQLTELTLGENSTLAYVGATYNKLSTLDISEVSILNDAILNENAERSQCYYSDTNRFCDYWSYEYNTFLTVDSFTEVIATQPLDYCSVTFDSKGGSEVPSVSVISGGRIVRPADPEKEGWVFAGWYQDTAFATPFEFGECGTPVEDDIVLYACWYQPVSIADTFPDEVFCEYVKQYDLDGDNALSYSELQNVTFIDVINRGVTSLEGIEVFFNLTYLYCSFNEITSLDVSSNKALTNLECNYCGLESLTFGENSVLSVICCSGNNITTLDVQGLPALYQIDCDSNQLTELIVSENPSLYSLNCAANQITSLDVSENGALLYLNCSNNKLTELTLGENDVLEYVYASVNNLSSLDVSQAQLIDAVFLNGESLQLYATPGEIFDSWGYDEYSYLQVDSVTEIIASQTYDRCTVTFDTDGGSEVASVSVLPGRRIPRPTDPEKEGWVFAGWYQNAAFGTPFEFGEYGIPVEEDIVLYACWYKPVRIEDTFPDETFRDYVSQYDTDEDGMLSYSEIQDVMFMNVSEKGITSLEGIETFINLQDLYCYENSISELDVSGNRSLMNLSCYGNEMTNLILGENSVLNCIHCENNNLTELNVQGLSALSTLNCEANQLTSLDVSKNSELQYLYCSWNRLTELTLGENSTLMLVAAQSNKLSSLDVSQVSFLNNALLDENVEMWQTYSGAGFYDTWYYVDDTILVIDSDAQVIATQRLDYRSVMFDSNGGSEVPDVSVFLGGRIVRPADPEKEKQVFIGWYLDKECQNPFYFGEDGTTVVEDMMLHALWANEVAIISEQPPISVMVMAGAETEVQIAAYGKEPITYQWQMYDDDAETWVNLSGEDATTDTLTFTAPAEKNIIRLRCVVTNGYGFPVASDEATVYINHLAFLTAPLDTVVQIGETVSFFVETSAENEPAYQWQYYDIDTEEWVNFPDESATTDTLSFVAGIEHDSLAFRCVATDEYNNVAESVGAVLHVTPIITSQTETAQALVGDKAEFSVSAEGVGPLSYQWQYRKNATDTWKTSGQIGNKTATLKVSTTAGMHGYQFRCVVTDGNNEEVISDAATLMLAPKITAQPEDAGAADGTKAKFTVAATGKSTLTYQWQYRTSATGTWRKSGQSGNRTATLTVAMKAGYDGFQFRCIVTDGNNQQTISEAATLIISPKITEQPTDASVTVGTRATFTVAAIGVGALTYQWQYRKNDSAAWANSGQVGNKTSTLSVAATAGLHGYQFRCIVTDGNSQQMASEAATLTLAPSITKQPADAFAGAGDKVKFTVTATGKSTLTYQWQYRTSASGTWKKSGQSGNKTATLTVAVKDGFDGYQFRCIVTDGNSQQTISEPATLTISPKITAQPTDASVTVGTRATFTVEATGEGTLTYQWQYRKDETREWANSGQTGNKTATLSVATTAGLHGYQFRCIVTDGSGRQLISNVATLALAPGITAQPEDTTAAVGTKATFTVTATGKATLTYQWQYRKDDTREWTNSGQSGNKTATLKVSTTKGLNGYQFRCVVTDGNEQITYTEVATLTVQ